MKPALLFFMIFSANCCLAQLHISPSGYGDSYMYVKDRLLYVEAEIDLRPNLQNLTEANIYLRNNAQLLQGDKVENMNSGTGKLSVFQKGTSNSFDYNYWTLPVAVRAPEFSAGDYFYEPLGKTESRKAKIISELDGKSNPLSISSKWLYAYSGTGYSSWQYLGNRFDPVPGEGFSMKGVSGKNLLIIEGDTVNTGSKQTYDLRGLPNDGEISIPIKKDQVVLTGNPYPSLLKLDDFLKSNPATTGIAYFWDSKANVNSHYLSDYIGGYGTYSPGTGQYVPPMFRKMSDQTMTAEKGMEMDRSIAPIAQGFMVIGKMDGEFVFKNNQRIYVDQQNNFPIFKNAETNTSIVRLQIEIDQLLVKELILAFNENSTTGEDHAMDARKMDDNSSDINWKILEEDYVINVRPKKDQELIPLKLNLEKDAQVDFSVKEMQHFDPDRFFVYDKDQDLYFGIKSGSLKLDVPAGEYSDRFYISFIEKLPAETDETEDDSKPETPAEIQILSKPPRVLLNSIEIFQNNSKNQLEINVFYDTSLQQISLYDLSGKQVYLQNFKASEKEFIHPTVNLSNAIYIVKVKTSDQIEITKKVGIRN